MAISRTLFASQTATLGGITLPVQNISVESTTPRDDVMRLGRLNSAARVQKEPSTSKATAKFYMVSGSGVGTALTTLMNEWGSGTPSNLVIDSVTLFKGICTNIAVDAAVGDFAFLSLTLEGIGTVAMPAIKAAPIDAGAAAFTPVTSDQITIGGNTVKSVKFSMDLPTDKLSKLGAAIAGLSATGDNSNSHLFVGKPPYKANIAIDGPDLTSGLSAVTVGSLVITITDGKETSKSYSNAAGDTAGQYSFTHDGTDVTFA